MKSENDREQMMKDLGFEYLHSTEAPEWLDDMMSKLLDRGWKKAALDGGTKTDGEGRKEIES